MGRFLRFILWLCGYRHSEITIADDLFGYGTKMIIIGKRSFKPKSTKGEK